MPIHRGAWEHLGYLKTLKSSSFYSTSSEFTWLLNFFLKAMSFFHLSAYVMHFATIMVCPRCSVKKQATTAEYVFTFFTLRPVPMVLCCTILKEKAHLNSSHSQFLSNSIMLLSQYGNESQNVSILKLLIKRNPKGLICSRMFQSKADHLNLVQKLSQPKHKISILSNNFRIVAKHFSLV